MTHLVSIMLQRFSRSLQTSVGQMLWSDQFLREQNEMRKANGKGVKKIRIEEPSAEEPRTQCSAEELSAYELSAEELSQEAITEGTQLVHVRLMKS